ncbi:MULTISPECIES: hypothetical protein [unclassified Streptomyces]|uniref:Peptidase inhibitor family I36 protein n=1 Tax=Streptomyces evansiae TaxID=3075535 RepID=A0ABD5E3K8_9ACTN|nr:MULTISPECIES: hypothetical protein [unclassified Streptomyces]ASY33362.1 hypothetical protein CAC01_12255 [Streptomyces sp. CLI2509]EGJ75426.1 hypothetical protein STTU_2638 [Streptomyces sp. Tu6071]MDT0415243.1 hypothetical protein [Streptomyces sp. DSM 41982]MYR29845.1 hypothetical protein [Streptomyces sp. SID4945]MYX19920.1 hypothetical protein [Streptomyces sp. SID8380]
MRLISRAATFGTALATAVAATIVFAGSPASAAGGYWAPSCDAGRACIRLSGGRQGPGGAVWNLDGCGYHTIKDHYDFGWAHGNAFDVKYADGRWDRVQPNSGRGLDGNNLVTGVEVLC